MNLTRYEKELVRIIADRFPRHSPARLVEELCRMGVIDHTLCKVMAVRRWVNGAVCRGNGKVAAMHLAANHFCVTYEYVRKCMYYYKDVNA
jgi:hypothetical protein